MMEGTCIIMMVPSMAHSLVKLSAIAVPQARAWLPMSACPVPTQCCWYSTPEGNRIGSKSNRGGDFKDVGCTSKAGLG